ncbi:MAG: endonuclease/exonuclease/phosphatase family protein [Bdellovibrionaceae bacterium]|nr:endonuclease/exonuclease/phosphatase family protein [Pseudobdellovibrionaceae bacterium]
MALQKKFDHLVDLDADVMVIQECSEKTIQAIDSSQAFNSIWFGTNKHKGVGVISKKIWTIKKSVHLGPKWTIHVNLSGPFDIDIYAVWACAGDDYMTRYIRQVHLMLDLMEAQKISRNSVVLGDFNSNSNWDYKYSAGRHHSDAVARLAKLGFASAYHRFTGEEQGRERCPTLYFRRNPKQSYHIDYIFLSDVLAQNLSRVVVGKRERWLELSDHMPVIADLRMAGSQS